MPETEKRQMKIKCPSCGSKLDVTDIEPFTVVPCPQCGFEVTIPKRFLSYVLEERLETIGGVNRYRALEETLDRDVCVVICNASETMPWERLERYLEILRKAASMKLGGTALVYACGRTEEGVYSVSGMPSSTVMSGSQGSRLPWKEAGPLIAAFATTLQEAAETGVLHGALGSRSFCLDEHGKPLLCGLGEGVLLTGGLADGAYASPERRDGGGCTLAADLYGFGVWCCRLLTGRLPSAGMDAIAIRESAPDVPPNVAGVLARMMSNSPLRRPRGYGSLLSELRIAGRAVPEKAKMTMSRRGEAAVSEQRGNAVSGVAFVVVLLILALGGTGGWMAWRMGWKPREASGLTHGSQGGEAAGGGTEEAIVVSETDSVADAGRKSAGVGPLPKEYRRLRPKPDDLRFDDEAVQAYLQKVPESWKIVEKERLARIIGIREYIFSLLRMPCRPEGSRGLRLRDGSFLRGYVAMGSETGGLVVRPLDGEHQSLSVTSVKLEELEWSEIWRMLNYYGHERRIMGQQDERMNRELFEHYLLSALTCEWYGYRKDADSFAKKALVANPGGKEVILKFGLNVE